MAAVSYTHLDVYKRQVLWLPDTFGYTAALPQILKGCGVKYLVTQKIFWSYNEGDPFPYHYFNWEGMDGTKTVSYTHLDGRYPRFQPNIAKKDETSYETDQSRPIPGSYSTLLSGMFQLFGDMEQKEFCFEGAGDSVGICMSDSGLFQRTFPDGIVNGRKLGDRFAMAKHKNTGNPVDEEAAEALMKEMCIRDRY